MKNFLDKHTSEDVWLVKALAGAAIAGSAFFYLNGLTPAEVLAGVV